jgi:RNA ligase
MKDYILYQKLLREVEEGRVSASRAGDLTIFKYTQDTHIQGLWNETNRQARGIIFRDDGTVVARPFPKFFNLGEVSESMVENLPWHEEVEIYEKVDGSCGIGYRDIVTLECECCDGMGWKLATPGSMESDQAKMGTKILDQYDLRFLPENCTPVFEIIYPANRIVVNYKGETFLSLLAIFELNGEEWHPRRVDQIAEKCGFRRPARYNVDLRTQIPFEENSEGYVARFASGRRVKVKSPAYLRVHRLLDHMSPKGVIELIRGKEYGVTVKELPQGIQQDFDDIRAYVQQMHDQLRIEAEDIAARIPEGDRKTQALWIQANTPNALTGVVFGLLDKKSMGDKIWKIVLDKVKDEKTKTIPQE